MRSTAASEGNTAAPAGLPRMMTPVSVGERVDLAERGGLQQAVGVDVVLADEVGDGAGDLAQSIDAAAPRHR